MRGRVHYPRVLAPQRKVPLHHAHGCLSCGRRYTDTCANGHVNGDCMTCQSGQPPPRWDVDWQPASCCRTHSVLVTDVDTLVKYALGGSGPWFMCRACARTHPFDPTSEPTSEE